MKIAVCFSGRAGSSHNSNEMDFLWNNIYDNFIYRLEELGHLDVFCHFWHTDEWQKAIDLMQPTNYQIENNDPISRQKGFEDYFFKANPEILKNIDRSKTEKGVLRPGPYTTFWPNNWANMFASIHKANQLKAEYEVLNGFEYDLVIRMRPDLVFPKDFSKHINECFDLKINEICIPHSFRGKRSFPVGSKMRYVVDTFALGTSYAMDCYSSAWTLRDEITDRALKFIPEKKHKACGTLLGTCLAINDINIRYIAKGISYQYGVQPLREWLNVVNKRPKFCPEIVKEWNNR